LIAATQRGLCALAFGDDDLELEAALAARHPSVPRERDGGRARRWLPRVLTALAQCDSPELPLDLSPTPFQHAVWQCLRAIPIGETRTYAQIANAIGRPSAARAVGKACAQNPVAVLVPCHRAVRSDGALGGYACGPERKRKLLAIERAIASATSGLRT
jgi:AraC family transcriptional regulator of adaptative response/methylated-DNA-[protein]-cysteine methyltransferase